MKYIEFYSAASKKRSYKSHVNVMNKFADIFRPSDLSNYEKVILILREGVPMHYDCPKKSCFVAHQVSRPPCDSAIFLSIFYC